MTCKIQVVFYAVAGVLSGVIASATKQAKYPPPETEIQISRGDEKEFTPELVEGYINGLCHKIMLMNIYIPQVEYKCQLFPALIGAGKRRRH